MTKPRHRLLSSVVGVIETSHPLGTERVGKRHGLPVPQASSGMPECPASHSIPRSTTSQFERHRHAEQVLGSSHKPLETMQPAHPCEAFAYGPPIDAGVATMRVQEREVMKGADR